MKDKASDKSSLISDSSSRSHALGLVLLAYIAFISLGLPDGLLGVAWPSIRLDFARPLDSLGLLLCASVFGYLVSSFFSGRMIAFLGIGGVLAASCAATGLGLIGYTLVPAWWMMVALGVVAGLGAGAIDAGLNTYIASNFGERAMQWLHASYGIGITMGPMIMTVGINLFHTWRLGYVIVGAAQIVLAVCFAFTHELWDRKEQKTDSGNNQKLTDFKTPILETLCHFRVWLSLLLFFVYAGVEVTLGSWAYTLLTESRGISPAKAGLWAGSYWGTFTIGRILAGFYTKRIGNNGLIFTSIFAALSGSLLLWWNPGEAISLAGVVIIGFAIAPIYPALVSGTVGRVTPRYAANTIGMQVGAAGIGVATLPSLAGVLAQRISLEIIPVYMVVLIAALFGFYLLSMRLTKSPEERAGGISVRNERGE